MIRVNGNDQSFVEETLASLLERLAIKSRGIAVAVNGDIVRRGEWATTPVVDGAAIEIVTAAAGG